MIASKLKVCIVCFDNFSLRRDSLTTFLDKHPDVLNWAALLPGHVFIVTRHSVNQVSEILRVQFPNKYFFVAEIAPISSDGWLPQQIWEFINNPTSVKEQFSYLAGSLPGYMTTSLENEE